MLGTIKRSPPIWQTVVQQLKLSLLRGDFKPGDKIPSEPELSQTLGVSRASIREALKILVALGMLEIRRGEGTFVASEVSSAAINPILAQFIAGMGPDRLQDLVEFRRIFEWSYLETVIQNLTETDISNLRIILEKGRALVKTGASPEAYKLVDLEFHTAIMECTRNQFVISMGQMLLELFEVMMDQFIRKPEGMQQSLASHESILQALEDRDLSTLRQVIQSSLESISA